MVSRNFFMGILLVTGLVSSFPAAASGDGSVSPLEIAIFPPLQLPGTDFGVHGLRLSVVGVNREARGLDLALLGNVTNQEFKGFAISGLFNVNRGSSTIVGLQVAGIANVNSGQNGVYGVQLALVNYSDRVFGLQLGLVNVATSLHGFQIGLCNINKTGPFRVSPIINAGF